MVEALLGPDYSVESMASVRCLGQYDVHNQVIRINQKLLDSADFALLHDVVGHEIDHALAGYERGHGPEWKMMAMELGAIPRASNVHSGLDIRANARYTVSCERCGWSERKGSYKRNWFCKHCSGKLTVVDRLRLEGMQT